MKFIVKCAFFSILLLSVSVFVTGCGGGGPVNCDGGALLVSTNPSPAVAYSNNTDTIGITVTGQDEECNLLTQGTPVELRITDQSTDNVGVFAANDSTTLNVVIGQFGASAEVKSTMPGTAKIVAFCAEYNLSATPVNITFETEPIKGQCAIELSIDPSVIEPDGISTSTITATLTNDTGGAMPDGTEVKFTTTLGKFVESNNTEHTTTSNGSVATATLQSADLTEDVDVTVTATFLCDDGNDTANSEQVRFGQLNNPIVNLRASANSVFADNVSTIDLVAEVYLPGGTKAGEGEEVIFTTTLSRFQESGTLTYTAHTDSNGEATATFIGGMIQGTAIIDAGVYIDEKNAWDDVSINIRALGAVAFVSATPSKLGVKGSGRDESSTLVFTLLDTEDAPFPEGALVTFTHSPAPGVTLDPVSARTDENGMVTTTLNAGRQATTVTVTATAQVGSVTLDANSPAIAIVGAKPNDRYMTFVCHQFNMGGFAIYLEEVECTVALADRYTNKIGFATNVIFKVEAGAITAEAITEEDGDDMGLAVTSTRSQDPIPADVTPVAGEPFVGSHNPRDGLVTVVAATTGEEEFTDINGNGSYDSGEPFVDIGEPFVDVNDNAFREPTEQFIDANSNDAYDGPNGVWDSDTLIWDQTWILWSGDVHIDPDQEAECARPSANRYTVLCPPSFTIGNSPAHEYFDWEVKDINLNPINETLRVDVNVEGEGDEGASSPELVFNAPDTTGGGLNGTGNTYWESGGGFSGWIDVIGDDSAKPPQVGSVSLEVDWNCSFSMGDSHSENVISNGMFL